MNPSTYGVQGLEEIPSPGLILFRDVIVENTAKAIAMAGGAQRLWPHVKSHKMREMIAMQRGMGIRRFKCATLAEARMTAQCGAEHVLLAYPLVGPNIAAFLALAAEFPQTQWYATGDDFHQLELLSQASVAAGRITSVLLDLNLGMDRTGVGMDRAEALYRKAAALPGLAMKGLHAYDGHRHEEDVGQRGRETATGFQQVCALRKALMDSDLPCALVILGGTPTFPLHAQESRDYLSPGTLFLGDWGYLSSFPDLPFAPGAALITRVISHPGPGLFTLDVGTKSLSSEMPPPRGHLLSWTDALPLRQSEEHLVYQAPAGRDVPAIGTALLLFPAHICPTVALHARAWVVEAGRVTCQWAVAARNR